MSRTGIIYKNTPIKYLQDTHQISQRHPSNIFRTPIKYLRDTHQLSPGQPQNISRSLIKCIQVTNQISPRHPTNISRRPIKYLQDTHKKFHENHQTSLGHLSNIFWIHSKYLEEIYEISPGNL